MQAEGRRLSKLWLLNSKASLEIEEHVEMNSKIQGTASSVIHDSPHLLHNLHTF